MSSMHNPEEMLYQQLVELRSRHSDLQYMTWRTITALETALAEGGVTELRALVAQTLADLVAEAPAGKKGIVVPSAAKPIPL